MIAAMALWSELFVCAVNLYSEEKENERGKIQRS